MTENTSSSNRNLSGNLFRNGINSLGAIALGLLLGLGIGLLIGWVIWPLEWTNAWPSDLSQEAKSQYLAAVAEAYVYYGDEQAAETARNRLYGLNDNLAEEITAAQTFFQNNPHPNARVYISNLGQLAQRLGVDSSELVDEETATQSTDAREQAGAEENALQAGGDNEAGSDWLRWTLIALAAILLVAGGVYVIGRLATRRPTSSPPDSYEIDDDFDSEFQPYTNPDAHSSTAFQPSGQTDYQRPPSQEPDHFYEDEPRFDTNPADEYGFDVESEDTTVVYSPGASINEFEFTNEDADFSQPANESGLVATRQTQSAVRYNDQYREEAYSEDTYSEDTYEDEFVEEDDINDFDLGDIDDAPEPIADTKIMDAESVTTDKTLKNASAHVKSQPTAPDVSSTLPIDEEITAEETIEEQSDEEINPEMDPTVASAATVSPLTTFTAHYQAGITDYDQSHNILDEKNGRYIGECGMGVNMKNGYLNNNPEHVIALDVWLFDKKVDKSLSNQTRILLSQYVIDNDLESSFAQERPDDPSLVVAEPNATFSLTGNNLILDCKIVEVNYTDSDPANGIFQSVKVDMVMRAKDG